MYNHAMVKKTNIVGEFQDLITFAEMTRKPLSALTCVSNRRLRNTRFVVLTWRIVTGVYGHCQRN